MLEKTTRYRFHFIAVAFVIFYMVMLECSPLLWMDEARDSAAPWNIVSQGIRGNSLFDGLWNGTVSDPLYGDASGNYDRIIDIYLVNRSIQG